tara:strand:- start:21706 stop:22911 length:1206 start_codon:yes stop_codon:yes gene_type:complete
MSHKPSILIAGAGIGGLTAALALLKRGFEVNVYEQAPVLGELGAGLQLGPDGTRILQALGLGDEMVKTVCIAAQKDVRLWDTGMRRKLFDLGEDSLERFGAPYWFVHRGDLHRVLREAVTDQSAGCIHTNKKAIGFEETENHVTLSFEDETSVSGDILIGADGIHSVVRDCLFSSPKPAYVGIVAWRGLAKMEDLPDELREPVGTNWVGPGGHAITYPLRRGEIMNFAAFTERNDWQVEGWSIQGTYEECHADFEGWNPLIHDIIKVLDQPFKWALAGRDPLQSWTKGRVTVLGDAAHPTLPFLAHGAIMALEDAYVLARCLSEQPEAAEAALKVYEQTRVERTTKIVNESAKNAERFHNPILSEPQKAIEYINREWEPEKVKARYDWLFEYDATTAKLAV